MLLRDFQKFGLAPPEQEKPPAQIPVRPGAAVSAEDFETIKRGVRARTLLERAMAAEAAADAERAETERRQQWRSSALAQIIMRS